jgi:hypothetical protein
MFGKRPLGSPSRTWEDSIRMDLREMGREALDWIQLVQISFYWRILVNAVMNLQLPQKERNSLTS